MIFFHIVILKSGICYLDVQNSSIKWHLIISMEFSLYFTLMG